MYFNQLSMSLQKFPSNFHPPHILLPILEVTF